ncbi:hypothetical protein Lal_00046358 [Lupinus albus]|nr:hypothetical protein Lal_00046358 [Lupinus albus]
MFKPALALAIYGKTLFPFVNDMVDQGAIDVLHKFRKFGVNPVPAILSDTLLAFQKSHEKNSQDPMLCTTATCVDDDHVQASPIPRFEPKTHFAGSGIPLSKQ